VSGLGAAIFLARRGFAVEVWESAAEPGGLLAPFSFRGVACDLGSHRLHGDALPLLTQATSDLDWQLRRRRGVLLLGGRQIAYPLRLIDFLRGLGPAQALRCGLDFLRRRASLRKFLDWEQGRLASSAGDDPGFERFVCDRVGDSAYHAFYRPYVEKVWGLPAAELSTVVAKKRISTSRPLRAATAPATFHYPSGGMAALVAALVGQAQRSGVRIRYGQRYRPGESPFATVVYSGHLADLTGEPPLLHRGLYLIYLACAGDPLGPIDTYYAPEASVWFGRVSVPGNFASSQKRPGESVLCVEIPEGRWGSQHDFLAQLGELVDQLRRARILPQAAQPIAAEQLFLPKVYPIYRRGFAQPWRQALAQLANHQPLFPIGRQGLFLHCNIDHCVQIASDVAAHIAAGGSSQAWAASAERYLQLRVRD
jgi:protoporphyrinogen oxidase